MNGLNLYAYCLNNPVNIRHSIISSGGTNGGVGFTAYSNVDGVGGGSASEDSGGFFNQVLANGSFRSGLWFGKGSVTALYTGINFRAQWNSKGKFQLGLFGKTSLFNAQGNIGFGFSNLNISAKGVLDVGLDDVYESNIVIIKEGQNIFSLPCSTFKYMRIWEDKMMKDDLYKIRANNSRRRK